MTFRLSKRKKTSSENSKPFKYLKTILKTQIRMKRRKIRMSRKRKRRESARRRRISHLLKKLKLSQLMKMKTLNKKYSLFKLHLRRRWLKV